MRYEISIIPNFGNKEAVIRAVKSFPGVETTGKTRSSGYYGSDVPVILDVECGEEVITPLSKKIKSVATDIVNIFRRCPTCGQIEKSY